MASPSDTQAQTGEYWNRYQPGFRFTSEEVGSEAFFGDIERHRYSLEPHLLELVPFDEWTGRDVLEVGCGIATDGARFARAGARYCGVDQSDTALALAEQRFAIERREGRFVKASAVSLPFGDHSFDFAYSNGVLHHITNTDQALSEIHRVLKPGGRALIMLYHRNSWNYRFTIMILRRALAATLLSERWTRLVARAIDEETEVLEGHRELLLRHGLRYIRDRELFLSTNTDGPGNTLSKVYSRAEGRKSLHRSGFVNVTSAVRYLNLRLFPGGQRLARTGVGRRLERRAGWHLYLSGHKP